MNAFEFNTVSSVIAEYGAARRFGAILRDRFKQERICLITDRFLHSSGLLAPTLISLANAGFKVTIIDDVVADPPEEVVLAAAERAIAADAEIIVGFGGGSSMDVAKLIAALLGSSQPLQAMYGVGNVSGPRLPLVQVPTTAGTGSEVTPISIVTTGATTKAGVVSPKLYADLTVLDAELTVGLPPHVTAATGIDAIVHAIESYTSKHKKNPMSDMLAREALRLLSNNLLPAFRNGANRNAREAMLLGAMLAGQAFANAPVAAVHALAYPIGGIFHVPHGLSNSLVLPHVLRFNAPAAATLYSELASIMVPDCSGSDEARCDTLIRGLEELAVATGIERRLRDVGIGEADLPRMASDAMLQTRLLVNNPREVSEADAYAIYQAAY
jgi:alcohol dehydrogenase